MNLITRRKFITQLSRNSGALLLSPTLLSLPLSAFAQAPARGRPRFFVVLTATGAMDCTLGLDPQKYVTGVDEKDIFIEYRPNEIVDTAVEAVKFAPAAAGLAPYAGELVVFNGLDMRQDLGHTTRYITTGEGGSSRSSCSIDIALAAGSGPFGVLNQGAIVNNSSGLMTVNDIDKAEQLELGNFLDGIELSAPDLDPDDPLGRAERNFLELSRVYPEFKRKLTEVTLSGGEKYAQVIAAAFMSGGARQAEVNLATLLGVSLDTHSSHERAHLGVQKRIWDSMAGVFKLFKSLPYEGGSLFDATLFFCATEFSRTPFLNGSAGKDHNIETNSVLLAGAGITGGQTIGASAVVPRRGDRPATHMGLAVEFASGRVTPFPSSPDLAKIGALQPAHIIRTIGAVFGDPDGYLSRGSLSGTPVLKSVLG